MRKISVGDVMTHNFTFVSPTTSIYECAKSIIKNKVNNLPVVYNRKLIGILNSRDLLSTIIKNPSLNLKKTKAIHIANKKVAVIKPSADLHEAIIKMRSLNFRTLPVISKGNIIGIVTLKDILRIEPELYPKIGELAEIREEERKIRDTNVEWPLEGFCDNCGTFNELLKIQGRLLCYDCREELF